MSRWLVLLIALLVPAQLSPAHAMPAGTADLAGMMAFCGGDPAGHHDQSPAPNDQCNACCCVAAPLLVPGIPTLPLPTMVVAVVRHDVSPAAAERFPSRLYASRAPPSGI